MSKPPYPITGLHPTQIRALRVHKGLTEAEFGKLFGTSERQVEIWEVDGLSTGPAAVAVRAVADAWSFVFPTVEGTGESCRICDSDAYHDVFGLAVCRSCFMTPQESMEQIGYTVSVVDDVENPVDLEVKAPGSENISMPPAMFGPEDWKTAVKKLRQEEHQTGYRAFDDLVYIGYLEPKAEECLEDAAVRDLISDLVPHGQLELIGDAARLHLFRRNDRPQGELVLRLGLLMSKLCENG